MWKNLVDRLMWWLVGAKISRQLGSLHERLDGLERSRVQLMGELDRRLESLQVMEARLGNLSGDVRKDIERTKALIQKYEEQLEAVQSKLRVAEESTIPTLVAANKTFVDRWDAESSVYIRRQVAISSDNQGEI